MLKFLSSFYKQLHNFPTSLTKRQSQVDKSAFFQHFDFFKMLKLVKFSSFS